MNNDSPDNSCYEVNIIACRKRKRRKRAKEDLEVSPLAFYIDRSSTGFLCMVKYAHNFHYALGK